MLSLEDWAEIRRLHRAEGLPIKVIARVLGMSKNTVTAEMSAGICLKLVSFLQTGLTGIRPVLPTGRPTTTTSVTCDNVGR